MWGQASTWKRYRSAIHIPTIPHLTLTHQQTTESASEFYDAKVKELAGNIQGLEGIVQAKTNNLRVVEEVLRQKVLAQGGPGVAGQASS
jgi:hypothetical protein